MGFLTEPPGRRTVLLAVAVFLASWRMTHVWFFPQHSVGDVPLYQSYGQAVRGGGVPFRDFPLEYPPGALPAFVVPALAGHAYATLFDWLMAACGVGCVLLAAASRPPRLALPFLAVSPLFLGVLVRTHFDLWPALLVAGGMAALVRDRHRLGWALLAGAFAAKLYGIVLLPLAFVWTLRRGGRGAVVRSAAAWAAVVAVAFVPFAIVAPHGLATTISGQASRPLQIETIAGSYLMTFAHPEIRSSHGSKSLPNHDGLAAATTAFALALLVVLWAAFARGEPETRRLQRYAAASVATFVTFGKILSPQYLIWLVPLVPLVRGRRGVAATGLLTLALIDTQAWFPGRYLAEYVYVPRLAWLVLARNLLLVAGLATLAAPPPPALGRLAASLRAQLRRARAAAAVR